MTEQTMLSVDQALHQILGAVTRLPHEAVLLGSSLGRYLTEDVKSDRVLPPFDNSAMDGYAVRAADVARASESNPVSLRVTQNIYAGDRTSRPVVAGEAARIMTGAPIPPGADTVVMQERARREGDEVTFNTPTRPGESVRPAGEDVQPGAVVLRSGNRIGPPEIALLASLGKHHVQVARRPRVAIFSTGNELCEIDAVPDGRIVDSNSWAVAAQVLEAGGEPIRLGIAKDDQREIEKLVDAAEAVDVVASTAGVSVGDRDFVREALTARGVEMRFWKVAMRPGKPLAFGVRGSKMFFGLPGNPTSSMVSFELFVRPSLLAMQGASILARPRIQVRLAKPFKKPAGLTWFVRAHVDFSGGPPLATPLAKQGSGLITSMVDANAFLVVPPDVEVLEEGAEAESLLLI